MNDILKYRYMAAGAPRGRVATEIVKMEWTDWVATFESYSRPWRDRLGIVDVEKWCSTYACKIFFDAVWYVGVLEYTSDTFLRKVATKDEFYVSDGVRTLHQRNVFPPSVELFDGWLDQKLAQYASLISSE